MDLKELIKKRPHKPPRIILYTIAGWGKSTLAASMPKPIFIDLEDGLGGLDADSFPPVTDYNTVLEYMRMLINEEHNFKTVIIDTASSLERLIFAAVCAVKKVDSVDDIGYGKGRLFAIQRWEKVINGLERLREKGMCVVVLAHSQVKIFNSPIVEPYDQYQLAMDKSASQLLTGWADNVFFGTEKIIVSEQGEGFGKRSKGIGHGDRVIYTEQRPAFIAKSRLDMPYEISIPKKEGWKSVAKYFSK